MKYFTTTLLSITLTCFLFAGCEAEIDTHYNHLKIDDNESLFTNGDIKDFGCRFNPDTFMYEIILATGTIQSLYPSAQIVGEGDYILLNIITNPEELDGNYTYTNVNVDFSAAENNDLVAGMILKSSFVYKDFGLLSATKYYFTNGKATIKVEGNICEITFSFTTENHIPVSGYYKGELNYQDFSE